MTRIPITRALISVYDKTGLEDLARGLRDAGAEIVSTGNTAAAIEAAGIPPVPILTSDVCERAPGGFFVVHSAFGKIGETTVGEVEIIGVDGEAYRSTFYDSFGNVHSSRLEIDGNVLRWTGERTRCTVTMVDDGMTQVARHEASADGASWTSSMDVILRKVA